jgi:hypothetical protein
LRELQRIDAKMALQMQHAKAAHVAKLGFLDRMQPAAA